MLWAMILHNISQRFGVLEWKAFIELNWIKFSFWKASLSIYIHRQHTKPLRNVCFIAVTVLWFVKPTRWNQTSNWIKTALLGIQSRNKHKLVKRENFDIGGTTFKQQQSDGELKFVKVISRESRGCSGKMFWWNFSKKDIFKRRMSERNKKAFESNHKKFCGLKANIWVQGEFGIEIRIQITDITFQFNIGVVLDASGWNVEPSVRF